MKSIRHTILAALAKEPMIMDGLIDATGMEKRQLSDNITAAIKDNLVERSKDDVTGMLLYTITAAGKKRLAEGPQSKGGKATPAEKIPKYPLSAFLDDVDAVLSDESETRVDVISRNGNDGLHYDECDASVGDTVQEEDTLPQADPALLASANRMLYDRLAGVAHALRGSGLVALATIDDREDLQMHVAALTGAFQKSVEDVRHWNMMADSFGCVGRGALIEFIENLQRNVVNLTISNQDEIDAKEDAIAQRNAWREMAAEFDCTTPGELRGYIENLERESIKGVTCISRPKERVFQGYACMVGGAEIYPDETAARMAAETALVDFPVGKSVAVVAVIAMAENVLAPLWKEAA